MFLHHTRESLKGRLHAVEQRSVELGMAQGIEQRIQHFRENAADITDVAMHGVTPAVFATRALEPGETPAGGFMALHAAAVIEPRQEEETALVGPDDGLSAVAGITTRDFKTYLSRALQGDTAGVPASILACAGAVAGREDGGDTKKRGDEWWEFYFWDWAVRQQAEALEHIARKYEEMAAWYKEQEGKSIEAMDRLGQLMEKSGEFLKEAGEIDDEWRRTGKFDRQKCLKALRERDVDVNDDISDEDLRDRFNKQKEKDRELMKEAQRLYEAEEIEREEYRKLREDFERKAREKWDAVDKLRAVQNDASLNPEAKHQEMQEIVKDAGAVVAFDAARWEDDRVKQAQIDSKIENLTASTETAAEIDLNDGDEPLADDTSKLGKDFNAANNPSSRGNTATNSPAPAAAPNDLEITKAPAPGMGGP